MLSDMGLWTFWDDGIVDIWGHYMLSFQRPADRAPDPELASITGTSC